MRLTKFSHACVRFEGDGGVLVVDPGTWSERAALDGVDAILFTHEHVDHVDQDALADALDARPHARVYTHPEVAVKLDAAHDRITTVDAGDRFEAAGFPVQAFGGWHAVIHPDVPRVVNLGFLIGSVYHPGDSFDVPDGHVDTLFVPISAPWLKLAEAIDFVRAVRPRQAFGLHDALLNDNGIQLTSRLMSQLTGTEYRRLTPGSSIELP
ncbi:MAG TPA: MBL fold metallo-hydrolase [Micromonosporaceae bacterium]